MKKKNNKKNVVLKKLVQIILKEYNSVKTVWLPSGKGSALKGKQLLLLDEYPHVFIEK